MSQGSDSVRCVNRKKQSVAKRWTRGCSTLLPMLASLLILAALAPITRADDPPDQSPTTLVTLDADSASVNGVLQILSQRSGLNIVTSPAVSRRKISIHLKDTPFEEALNLVVRGAGLGYERMGNSILVGDVQSLAAQTGLTSRVFDLQYVNAEEARKALEVVSKDISAVASGNRLVVRASQSMVEQVERIVMELDRKPGQVLLEARIIEVNTTALLEAGIDWEKITKWSTVLTEGDPGSSNVGQLPQDLKFIRTNEYKNWHRQLAAFEVHLDALVTEGDARLLANSKVVTVDNVAAEIFVGETVPVVITSLGSAAGASGAFQTIQLEKIDVGIKLKITPRISDDGYITTLVEPEVSTITAFVGPDNDLPQTAVRRARSIVRVRDGERIFLGGLLSEQDRRVTKQAPLLGKIPLIGVLFQHHRDDRVKLDLVIEIIPRIVGDGAMLPPVTPGLDEVRPKETKD